MSKMGQCTEEELRRKWIRRVADDIIGLERFMGNALVPDEGAPTWVNRLEHEVGLAMFPVAKLRNGVEDFTPRRMGALLGHLCAFAVWMLECAVEEAQRIQLKVLQDETGSESPTEVPGADWELDKYYNQLRRIAKKALATSVDMNFDDMSSALLGFSTAFAKKPRSTKGLGEIGKSNFEILFFMLFFWRTIQHLNSVHHLHQVLVKVIGPYRTGDLKRIEKICTRIDLHYRKRGRPRNPENSDKPTSAK